MSAVVNVVLIEKFTLCDRAELRFALRTTCKQLNTLGSVLITSEYYELIC